MSYQSFIAEKLAHTKTDGIDVSRLEFDARYSLMPHQGDLAAWALRRGRAAIFADTGLGKTRMQLAWANTVHETTGQPVIVLCPLAVADQTVGEGRRIGVNVTHCRTGDDAGPGVNVINYDRLHLIDSSIFAGVVLDESSIIKHHTSKTLGALMDAFRATPHKLCATATPAPNDWVELGTHAQFLGVRTQAEMLAEFFVHDGGETQVWRLKGHARKEFWRWVATWGAMVKSPADLGHDASAYDLPPLSVHEHIIDSVALSGQLFAGGTMTLSERRSARKDSLSGRVKECAELVNRTPGPWVVWCELNAEGDALTAAIDGAAQVSGADSAEHKERILRDFAEGRVRVLVSKPSICGWGLNWQHCANIAFAGVSDSWESYYQAVRRCWRFGQTKPVSVHLFVSEAESTVLANLKRKESDAHAMSAALSAETLASVRESVFGSSRESNKYEPKAAIKLPAFMGGVKSCAA